MAQCPAGLLNCASVGYSDTCCPNSEKCYIITAATGTGVGCCPTTAICYVPSGFSIAAPSSALTSATSSIMFITSALTIPSASALTSATSSNIYIASASTTPSTSPSSFNEPHASGLDQGSVIAIAIGIPGFIVAVVVGYFSVRYAKRSDERARNIEVRIVGVS